MSVTVIILLLLGWCVISIPAYLIAALGTLGGNSPSKFLLLLAAPVLIFIYGSEYIREFFTRKKK